jgi:hypothetical protein
LPNRTGIEQRTEVYGRERLTVATLDRIPLYCHIVRPSKPTARRKAPKPDQANVLTRTHLFPESTAV